MTAVVPAPLAPGADVEEPVRAPMLGKVLLILGAFDLDGRDLSLAELVARVGLPKSTVHRLCSDLVDCGLLERAPPSLYRLGLPLWELGQRVPRQRALRDAALPHLERLLLATRQTVHVAVLDGTEVLYIDKLTLQDRQPRPSRVAGRLPLHCTATGKVLLAHAPAGLVAQVLAAPLPRCTPYTITAPGVLARQLATARSDGVAIEREETRFGYLSVAAAVLRPGGAAVGAISVTAPVGRGVERALEPAVRTAARAVTAALAGADAAARGGGWP